MNARTDYGEKAGRDKVVGLAAARDSQLALSRRQKVIALLPSGWLERQSEALFPHIRGMMCAQLLRAVRQQEKRLRHRDLFWLVFSISNPNWVSASPVSVTHFQPARFENPSKVRIRRGDSILGGDSGILKRQQNQISYFFSELTTVYGAPEQRKSENVKKKQKELRACMTGLV